MPLMERVRDIRADEARIDDAQLRTARQVLLREIARAERPVRRGRGLRVGLGVGGAGALVAGGFAVAALVAGSVVAPLPGTVAPASAAVFEKAAEGAITAPVVLRPGQYLRIQTVGTGVRLWDADATDVLARLQPADPVDAEAALEEVQTTETYVPADQSQEWIGTRDDHLGQGYGVRVEEARADFDRIFGGDQFYEGVFSYPAGLARGGKDGESIPHRLDSADEYADLPTDTEGVLAWFEEKYAGVEDDGGIAHFFIENLTDVATFNLMPA